MYGKRQDGLPLCSDPLSEQVLFNMLISKDLNPSIIQGSLDEELAEYQQEIIDFSPEELRAMVVLDAVVGRTLDSLKLNLLFDRLFHDLGFQSEIQVVTDKEELPGEAPLMDPGAPIRFLFPSLLETGYDEFTGWIDLVPLQRGRLVTDREWRFLRFFCRQVWAVLAHQWLYQNLTRTQDRLRSALNTVQEVSAFVGHEVRSPISSLLSLGYLMEDDIREMGRLSSQSGDDLKPVVDKMAQMVALLQKITRATYLLGTLEFDPGHLSRDQEWVEVGRSILVTASTAYSFDIRRRRLMVVIRRESGFAHEHVLVHRAWFEAVFDNLLGNAVKYSSEGGRIDISILRREGSYVIHVSNPVDHPPAPDRLNRLFEKGYRGEETNFSIQTIGANQGLGLYFVNRIVTLGYNGKIRVWVDSVRNSDGVGEGETVETQVFGDPDTLSPEVSPYFHIEIRIPEEALYGIGE